jgi:hypothetical protein
VKRISVIGVMLLLSACATGSRPEPLEPVAPVPVVAVPVQAVQCPEVTAPEAPEDPFAEAAVHEESRRIGQQELYEALRQNVLYQCSRHGCPHLYIPTLEAMQRVLP